MEAVLLLIRLLLFGVFALAGVGKLADPQGSVKAVRDFGVPAGAARPLAFALPLAELLVGALLLPVTTAFWGAIGAFLLLAVFIGGMLWQMAQGNAPDCHCFGAIHSEPVSKKSLLRNLAFAALAFVLVARGPAGPGLSLADLKNEMALQLFLGLATVGLLGAAVLYLKKISEQQTLIMRRIELLELVAHEGGERSVERPDAGSPEDALPIGAPAPDFELPDVTGRAVAFEHLLAAGKPLLLFFVSPTCGPCAALLPEIEEWQKELAGRVDFVFVSSGESKVNAEKFGGAAFKRILLQKDREVSTLFYARWTPTTVFVNAEGLVASRPAVGDESIRELVGKIKTLDFARPDVFVPNGAEHKLGVEVPEFSLPDLSGRPVTANDLRGRRTLVTFWSTTCPHCLEMIRDLKEWDHEKGADDPHLLVLSQGAVEDHRALGLRSPIVLDEGYKTAEKFGMYGTPSAVMVDEHGRIVSETAVGAGHIWALVGRRK